MQLFLLHLIVNKSFFYFSANSFGDVNISAILNSFQMGYDKRVRPNYGGKITVYYLDNLALNQYNYRVNNYWTNIIIVIY